MSTDGYGVRKRGPGERGHNGVVFDDTKVVFAGNADGMAPVSCGFASGSWRIAGPTG